MNKRPQITERTRQKLADAFWILYRDNDLERIRISQITDMAGYHRGTFYEYFTDIYDLLLQEEKSLVNRLAQTPGHSSHENGTIFSDIISFYQENGERISLLIRHGNMSFLDQMKQSLYPMFLEEYSLLNTGQAATIFEFGFNGLLMSYDYWYNHQDCMSLEEYLTTLRSMIQNGISQMLDSLTNQAN